MINDVTFRIVARKHSEGGCVSLNAQCFVNGARVLVPLGVRVAEKHFDAKTMRIKQTLATFSELNQVLMNAEKRAFRILADANEASRRLDKQKFKMLFTHSVADADFITFYAQELEARRGEITHSTYLQQKSSLKKLSDFKSEIRFSDINQPLVIDYERYLRIKRKNGTGTVGAALKNFKTYIGFAMKRNLINESPFTNFRIEKSKSRLVYLNREELHRALDFYDNKTLNTPQQDSLLCFLIACFTSLRVSDIRLLNPTFLEGMRMRFVPLKTKRHNKEVSFELHRAALRLLTDFFIMKRERGMKADQQINADLKIVAARLGFNKNISMHIGRHTFATVFLQLGGKIEVLQEIMGHSRIDTTRIYSHVVDESKDQQMRNFNKEFE